MVDGRHVWWESERQCSPVVCSKRPTKAIRLHSCTCVHNTHTLRLQSQRSVGVCRGIAGFTKTFSCMTSPALVPVNMNPHTDTHLIDLSSISIPDMWNHKWQMTLSLSVLTHHTHTHTRRRQEHTALKYCYGNSWPQGFVEPKTLDAARCFITSLTCLHVDPP